jgi:hypothetical protein
MLKAEVEAINARRVKVYEGILGKKETMSLECSD